MNSIKDKLTLMPFLRGALIKKFCTPFFVTEREWGENSFLIDISSSSDEKTAAECITKSFEDCSKDEVPASVEIKLGGESFFFGIGQTREQALKNEMPFTPNILHDRNSVVKNKICLVTGGAQGFGKEIATDLVKNGAFVFIADLNIDGAEKTSKELGKNTHPIAVNVSEEASVQNMFNEIVNTSGGLDLCVSNAGVLRAGSVLEQSINDFRFVTNINYVAFFIVCKYASLLFRKQHMTAGEKYYGDIIQINSKSGLQGSNKNGAYAGGKFGGIGLVQSFAMELIEYNIKVNAICPGNFYDGPLWSDKENGLFVQYLRTGKVPGAETIEDVRKFYEAKAPIRRGCVGEDVMKAIFYIVEQNYETGQAVPVTGGQVMLK